MSLLELAHSMLCTHEKETINGINQGTCHLAEYKICSQPFINQEIKFLSVLKDAWLELVTSRIVGSS
jgi:hypothetical protein